MKGDLEAKRLAHICARRMEGVTFKEIARELGVSAPTVRQRVILLHKQGKLSYETAFGYRGKPPSEFQYKESVRKLLGPRGEHITAMLTIDEAQRIGREVQKGGFSGYTEFLLELFRDWAAEQDARR